MKPIIHTIEANGHIIQVLQEGNLFTEVERIEDPQSLNGIFSKGGLIDNAIQTASGIFKKKDGTDTFIGSSIKEVANSFVNRVADNFSAQNQFNTGTPAFDTSFLVPGQNQSQLPTPGANPLPPSKDNTLKYMLIGVASAAAIGTAAYFITKS